MSLTNPYKNTIFYTRVRLLPIQMNNELYINLKNNLMKKVEKKCNKYGYINKVFKILSYSDGLISPEDFSGSSVFNIKYSANACIPVENSKIVVKIEKMNNMAILAKNGPIKVVLKYDKIFDKFKVVQGVILYTKEDGTSVQVKSGDFLIITILAKRFYNKDNFISVYGYIDSVPTEKEVSSYYEPYLEETEAIIEEKKLTEYVTFNEDDNIEDNKKETMVIKEDNYKKQSRIINI
jgi:DNA-directed RNA polymerase subunit E'/Rpb7